MRRNRSIFSRRRYSASERARWVAQYERSQLTQREFAQRHGFSLAVLTSWLRRTRQKEDAATRVDFVPVKMDRVLAVNDWAAEVELPQGVRVRLRADVPVALAEQLLLTLGRAC